MEHIHIPIVEMDFLIGPGRCEASSYVPEVDHKDASLAAVVVDLLEYQGLTARFCARPDAVEVADVWTGEGVDDPVEAQASEGRFRKGVV